MEKIIKVAVERGASDVHIKAGDVFRARIDGQLVPLTKQRLTPDQTKTIALKLIPNELDRARIDQLRDYDCSWGMPGVGRFRVNILRQRSSFMIVMRVIPFTVPTLDALGLPGALKAVALGERGLVLVSGPSGSGKSHTVAALVNHINQEARKHIVTVENPIEFLHRDINGSVTQREVGVDTDSFAAGLRAALRQDPDVVVVSDLRDLETLDTAFRAAETGHLVIAAMAAPDAGAALSRLVACFPPDGRELGRVRLAEALSAVVAQRLLPRRDGRGRVAGVELVLASAEVRACIAAGDHAARLRALVADGHRELGMQTLEQHLHALVREELVSAEAARAALPEAQRPGLEALLAAS
ncbi:MAG TPA: PilT/PilU family type 4a pilus ATPase [Gemmatimonadales bacterium]|nr:PilT/PilU family type 4a pilus ATPase [Gemmatimonadales bacterium]